MLRSFANKETLTIFQRGFSKRLPPEIQRIALRKLRMLHQSASLEDLRIPPSNHLETLKGSRKGQFSIRINRQWRICFLWINGDAVEVEIVDYH